MDTKALRQKILDLAIHGKLVPQDPNDEPASVLLERIRAEKERLIKEGKIKKGKKSAKTSDKPHYPFELPKGWEWVTLEDICAKFSTGPFGSMVHKSDYVTANGVPIVNPANIVNGTISSKNIMYISKDKSIELERYKLEVNDIVLARRGDLTKCTIVGNEQVDFICGTGSFFLHLISVLPQYFQLVYMSSYVQIILTTECVGATMNNLNQSVLSQILFPLPPLAEQKRVVARTKYMLSIITTLDNEQYSLHTTIKQAKAKVLDLAIHGKLVPQDPNDEPASELLKRINPKAEITCDTPQYGKLPKGWCETHIGDAFKVTMGQSPDGSSLNPIDGMEFHQGKILFGNKYLRKSSVLTNSPTKIADADTLLLCVRAPVGVVNITKQRICIGRGLCCLTPTKAINLDYAFYVLTTFREKE